MASRDRLSELKGDMRYDDDEQKETKPLTSAASHAHRSSLSTPAAAAALASSSAPSSSVALAPLQRLTAFQRDLASIAEFTAQIDALKSKVKTAASPAAREAVSKELTRVTHEAGNCSARARRELNEVMKENLAYAQAHGVDSDSTQLRNNLAQKAARDFSDTMHRYQGSLQAIQTTLRKRSARDILLVEPTLSPEKVEELVESGAAAAFVQSRLLSESLKQTVDDIESRHLQIRRLESEILQLSELFRDVNTLVDLQQESLDVISKNIEKTRRHAEQGEVAVNEAETWQAKARKYRVCLCILLLIILAAVLAPTLYTQLKKA